MNLKLPGDKEDLASLNILNGDEIKIKDGITALIRRKRSSEIFITSVWVSNFVHHYFLIFNHEHNETMVPLCF